MKVKSKPKIKAKNPDINIAKAHSLIGGPILDFVKIIMRLIYVNCSFLPPTASSVLINERRASLDSWREKCRRPSPAQTKGEEECHLDEMRLKQTRAAD